MWLPCPPMPTSAIARGECRSRISRSLPAISLIAVSQEMRSNEPSGRRRSGCWVRCAWRTYAPMLNALLQT